MRELESERVRELESESARVQEYKERKRVSLYISLSVHGKIERERQSRHENTQQLITNICKLQNHSHKKC